MNPVTIALLRCSTDTQTDERQELLISQWALSNERKIDRWIRTTVSSRKSVKERNLDFLQQLQAGDTLVCSDLSRVGRSVSELVRIVTDLNKANVNFISLKENIFFDGSDLDISSKTTLVIFSLLAEIERDLISQRTKDSLAAKKAAGVKLGRPKGSRSSKLDPKREEIQNLISLGVSKASIAKIVGVTAPALHNWVKSRNI